MTIVALLLYFLFQGVTGEARPRQMQQTSDRGVVPFTLIHLFFCTASQPLSSNAFCPHFETHNDAPVVLAVVRISPVC